MEHAAYDVDILDNEGNIVAHKPRQNVDKATDIYHAIHIFLITPDAQLVLTRIAANKTLPNQFAGKWGVPVATIRRSNESAEAAASRAVARELFIADTQPVFVGEAIVSIEGVPRLISAFTLIVAPPRTYSKHDAGELTTMSPREFTRLLRRSPDDISPTLKALWELWQERLPI